jgi:CheY-like chemotaxis protein
VQKDTADDDTEGTTMRILLADDEPSIRRLYQQMLEGNGYDIVAAIDGKEALERVTNESFDLMILDLNMPILDGFEVMTKMKEAGKKTPVIVMTGHFPEEVVEDRLEGLSVVEVLRKPVMITTLLNAVKRVT